MSLKSGLLTSVSLLLLQPSVVWAQDGEDSDSLSIEEIVVTAQKREQSIQDVPISMSAIGEEDLKKMGAENYLDYLTQVPSVSIITSGPGHQRISIRGISDAAGHEAPTQSTVGIYLDEVVISNERLSTDLKMIDIERIEVLRGPQGTLYGDASIGGTIRIISNKPEMNEYSFQLGSGLSTTKYGSGNYSLSGIVNIPIAEDKLAFRGVVYYYDNDGFIENVQTNIDNINNEKTIGWRASLRLEATENFNITTSALVQDQELGSSSIFKPDIGELKIDTVNTEFFETEYEQYNITGEYEGEGFNILSATSFYDYKNVANQDFTDLIESIFGIPLPSLGDIVASSDSFSQEIRISSNTDSRFNWLFGGYYLSRDSRGSENDVTEGLTDMLGLAGSPFDIGLDVIFFGESTNKVKKEALFGQVGYELTDTLEASIGMRWFKNKLERESFKSGIVFGLPFTSNQTTKEDKVNLAFRLTHNTTEDVLLYVSATEGYRIGGFNNISPLTQGNPDIPENYQSDSLWNYEFGWNTSWANDQVFFNGAAFYTKWTGVQVTQVVGGFAFIGNGGRASSYGIEMDINAQVNSKFRIAFGGALINPKYNNDIPALNALKGDPLPGSIKSTFNASAHYDFNISEKWNGYLSGYVSHTGTIAKGGFVDVTAGNYQLGNLKLGASNGSVELALFVNNIWDERAITQATTRTGNEVLLGANRPRTIGLSLSLKL